MSLILNFKYLSTYLRNLQPLEKYISIFLSILKGHVIFLNIYVYIYLICYVYMFIFLVYNS